MWHPWYGRKLGPPSLYASLGAGPVGPSWQQCGRLPQDDPAAPHARGSGRGTTPPVIIQKVGEWDHGLRRGPLECGRLQRVASGAARDTPITRRTANPQCCTTRRLLACFGRAVGAAAAPGNAVRRVECLSVKVHFFAINTPPGGGALHAARAPRGAGPTRRGCCRLASPSSEGSGRRLGPR